MSKVGPNTIYCQRQLLGPLCEDIDMTHSLVAKITINILHPPHWQTTIRPRKPSRSPISACRRGSLLSSFRSLTTSSDSPSRALRVRFTHDLQYSLYYRLAVGQRYVPPLPLKATERGSSGDSVGFQLTGLAPPAGCSASIPCRIPIDRLARLIVPYLYYLPGRPR
jgi:hypothetical protein